MAAIATGKPISGIATLRIDNRRASAEMVALVVAKGHRRIAFVSGPSVNSDSFERLRGYRDELQRQGIPVDPLLHVEGNYDYASGLDAGRFLLDLAAPPTAVICGNDAMASGVVAAALERGMVLPSDLAVAGFDDTLVAAYIWPSLTVVRQPIEAMAFQAVELLFQALANDGEAAVDVLLPHEIVERNSTAANWMAR